MRAWNDGPVPLYQPSIVTGADGLPHCATCLRDPDGLCKYHARQVHVALGQLKTASRTHGLSPMSPISKRVTLRGEREA